LSWAALAGDLDQGRYERTTEIGAILRPTEALPGGDQTGYNIRTDHQNILMMGQLILNDPT
jgi:hypothetical protein